MADMTKISKNFAELKQSYDRARTSYEMAKTELENIDKELKKKGLTCKSIDKAITDIQHEIDTKEATLEKMMEKLGGIIAKIRKSQE